VLLGGLAAVGLSLGTVRGALAQSPPKSELPKAKITDLATRWWKSRPPTCFQEWDPKTRAELEAAAREIGAIPEGSLAEVVQLLWQPGKKSQPRAAIAKGKIQIETPYGKAWAYLTGTGKNPPLVIGLHGGGEGAGSADEARSNWTSKGTIGIYPQGIRLIHDTWNSVHGERFVLSLIEIAKAQLDVDPDRVYCAGFSMGGSGTWFMAGRHPDLFAGAGPYSGVIMAAPRSQLATKEEVRAIQHGLLPNVRNLPMWYTIGLADDHCMPGTYLYAADVLEGLRTQDPGGYAQIHFTTVPKLGHEFPPGEPEKGLKFLREQVRDPFPAVVVWEYTTDPSPSPEADDKSTRLPVHDFYWLRCARPQDLQKIRASLKDNAIDLECSGTAKGVEGITLFLNPRMIDVGREVVVRFAGKEIHRSTPAPDFWTVFETLDARLDRSMVFDRRIEL